jgi:pimeloyl-ACP methyl ester carboxylesterase
MYITVEDAKIFTVAYGQTTANPVLAIGGWIGSWELWSDPFTILSSKWRVIAYDHRGTGATVASNKSITFKRLVDDVIAVMDSYQLGSCVLAAESAGAMIALSAAITYPERIKGLVIVDGYYYNGTPEESDPFLTGLKSNYSQTLEGFVQACVPEEGCEHIKRWGRQILERATPEAAITLYRMTAGIDIRQEVRQIGQPTLILHGDSDRLIPLESARWLEKSMPDARLVVLKGAGHIPTMTRPHEVANEMMSFLESIDQS